MSEDSQPQLDHDGDFAKVEFHPPKALLIWIVLGVGANWILPSLALPGLLRQLGFVTVLAALGLFGWAMSTFKRVGTDVKTSTPADNLATDGPYGITRNPIYLAMLMLGTGLGLLFSNVWLLVGGAAFFILITEKVIRHEEVYMADKFGDDYRAYCANVRRWI